MLKAAKVAKVSESSDAACASNIAPASDPPASDAVAARGDVPTPYDAYFDSLEKCKKDTGALGFLLIRGVQNDDEEDDSDDDSCEKYTAEQMKSMRVMIITESREKFMKKAQKFATCDQVGSFMYMFNTHSGNTIIAGIPKEVAKVYKLKTAPERFDGMFALTLALCKNDYWSVLPSAT